MTNSLFEHELIKTTLPKAKELRRVAEPLITLAKEDTLQTAVLLSAVCNKDMVGKLFSELGPSLPNSSRWIFAYHQVRFS